MTDSTRVSDPLGVLLLVLIISIRIFQNFTNLSIASGLAASVSILSLSLYIIRSRELNIQSRSPVSDSLISLSIINIFLFFLSLYSSVFSKFIVDNNITININFSVILIIGGVFSKLILLDQFLFYIFQQLKKYITSIRFSPQDIFVIILLSLASWFVYLKNQTPYLSNINNLPLVGLILYVVAFLFDASTHRKLTNHPLIRIAAIILGLLVFTNLLGEFSAISSFWNAMLGISIIIWGIKIYTIRKVVISALTIIRPVLVSFKVFFSKYRLIILRVSMFILGVISYFILPKDTILGIFSLNTSVAFVFVSISLLPTLIKYLKIYIPGILHFLSSTIKVIFQTLKSLFINISSWIKNKPYLASRLLILILIFPISLLQGIDWGTKIVVISIMLFYSFYPNVKKFSVVMFEFTKIIFRYFNNMSRILGFSGIVGLFISFLIPENYPIAKLLVLLLSSILLSFAWGERIFAFFEYIIYFLISLVYYLKKTGIYLLQFLNINRFISLVAWLLLFFSIFYKLFYPNNSLIRWSLFFFSIIVWHIAYDYRRVRLMNFLQFLTRGVFRKIINLLFSIYRLIKNLLIRIWQNIIFVVAIIISFSLTFLSFGLFFPSVFTFSSNIFGDLVEDRMVSWIVGITLLGVAILALQQSFVNRERLKMEGSK